LISDHLLWDGVSGKKRCPQQPDPIIVQQPAPLVVDPVVVTP
jgi:hypothetical protein